MKSSASTHTVEEQFVPAEHRDTASSNADNEFNLATDEENIDFNIPRVPNSMVKRSHGVNVHNLIQKIENHPQRQALQSDLQQHRAFNPFSKHWTVRNTRGTLASSTARAGTSYEMIRQRTRSTSSPFLISSLSRTFTSGRADHTVTDTGRKKVINNTTRQINSKRSAGNEVTRTFTIDSFVTHGSENPCWNGSY